MPEITLICFTIMGFLGGVTYSLLSAKSWEELKTFHYSRRMILGAIIGFLYNFLYSDYSFPNFIMSFVSGYMGTDFIAALIEKLRKPTTPQ